VAGDSDSFRQYFSTTHRCSTAVGFLFPSAAVVQANPNHMHHEIETLEYETAESDATSRHGLTLLSNIYLEAGLPLDLAIQSAVADCALFEEEALCG
jgi:hypothetical protein